MERTFSRTTRKGIEKERTRLADYSTNALDQYVDITSSSDGPAFGRDNGNGHGKKTASFRYDKNGNLIDDGERKYSYDYRNRLAKVETYDADRKEKLKKVSLIASFHYDLLGRRVEKTSYDGGKKDSVTRYAYAGYDAVEETDHSVRDGKRETLAATREYVYGNGIDDVLAVTVSRPGAKERGDTYFYHKDRLGSVVALTDAKGKSVANYAYDEFGRAFSQKPGNEAGSLKESPVGDSRLYTGREYDRETGLHYYRARYYSAELGRFLSRDPVGTADQINPYSYVANNPLKYVDPMGREKSLIILTIDKWGLFPTFDESWFMKNWENSYVASQYNSLISGNPGKKFDIRLAYDFESFDRAINERQREEIYFIGHGNPDSITLNYWAIWTTPDTYISLKVNEEALSMDGQTQQQAEMLSNTTLYLLSCYTGNELMATSDPIAIQLENHYWFKSTHAPSQFIYPGGKIYTEVGPFEIQGEWNIFTK